MGKSTLLKIPRMRLSYADEMLLINGCPGVIGLAAVFSGEPPAPDRVRARIAERWSGLERMHHVLDLPAGGAGGARWTVPGPFDPGAHVAVAPAGLDALWATSVDRPLPGGLPPWRLYIVPGAAYGGDFALALVAQHTLLDGRSLATLMRALVDTPAAARSTARPAPPRTGLRAAGRELRTMTAVGQSVPLRPPGEARAAVAVRELAMDTVRSARRQPADGRGATLNELLVAAVAGALRARYGPVREWSACDEPVYTAVPCDLRTRTNTAELGNTVTVVRVPLPVDVDGPVARLRACQAALATVPDRAAVHAGVLFPAAEAVRRTGPWVTRLLTGRGRHTCFAATATTALKWPGAADTFDGRRLVRTVGLPPLQRPGTASFALAQVGDAVTLTVVSHLRPDDAGRLADAVVAEFGTWARTTTPSVP
ncbi:wax ester/triacylglycerol synthase domain-containing protein [Streptomyces nigra]|uniref:wax ester/triacylglycerol synthase domain-containing protein n=1 Tax=Streptomyces nigra TaxID=1827580 RepID=UPI0030CBED71